MCMHGASSPGALSLLESSQTVTIILYNRYNSNASYVTVVGRRREKIQRARVEVTHIKREVLIRKTVFTIVSIK